MKKLLVAAAALVLTALGWSAPALASNCSPYPYTLSNGTTADANQVQTNFNTVMTCANSNLAHNGSNSDITSLSGLSTPLSAAQGGTGQTYGLAVDFNAFVGGLTGNAWTLASYQPSTSLLLTTGLSHCSAGTNATTATVTYTLKDNGSAVGTAVFTSGGSCTATITSSPYTVTAGHTLTITGPATGDTTLADIGITFGGTRQ